jgi:hypothetical protein
MIFVTAVIKDINTDNQTPLAIENLIKETRKKTPPKSSLIS